jgi:hypothetical protein
LSLKLEASFTNLFLQEGSVIDLDLISLRPIFKPHYSVSLRNVFKGTCIRLYFPVPWLSILPSQQIVCACDFIMPFEQLNALNFCRVDIQIREKPFVSKLVCMFFNQFSHDFQAFKLGT